MQAKSNRNFFIVVISLTILIIIIQLYWNFKAYKNNQAQQIFKIHQAFDKAVNEYYFELGKSDVISILDTSDENKTDSTRLKDFFSNAMDKNLTNLLKQIDTNLKKQNTFLNLKVTDTSDAIKVVTGKEALDEIEFPDFRTNQITIKISRDTIAFVKLKHIIDSIFLKQNIESNFNLYHLKEGVILDSLTTKKMNQNILNYESQSDFIKRKETIKIQFNNPEKSALKMGWIPLILSLSISISIMLSIFRLIRTVQNQKKIAEIKDDFIGNITHEFKTPIATASAAIEALDKFNLKEQPEKAKKYLNISNEQLKRLDKMVEKVLELSTIENGNLNLQKETKNLVQLITILIDRFKKLKESKSISFSHYKPVVEIFVDSFYFSSALSNLIENAIKYGGEEINISIVETNPGFTLTISDNGTVLKQEDESLIFDKFSRKNKGNTQNISGNGIGLYFSKQIIEKHGGTLKLDVTSNQTSFIIKL